MSEPATYCRECNESTSGRCWRHGATVVSITPEAATALLGPLHAENARLLALLDATSQSSKAAGREVERLRALLERAREAVKAQRDKWQSEANEASKYNPNDLCEYASIAGHVNHLNDLLAAIGRELKEGRC